MPPVKKLALALAAVAFAAPAGAATPAVTVKVKDDVFVKSSVTIEKGETVKWVWKGDDRHNVFQVGGPGHFHSPTQTKGTFTHRFRKAGTYRFQCTYHTPMKMTVKVTS